MVKTAGVKEEVPRKPQGTKPDNNDTNLKIANRNHAWNAWVWQEIHAFTRFSVARQQQKYRYAYKSAGSANLRAADRPRLYYPPMSGADRNTPGPAWAVEALQRRTQPFEALAHVGDQVVNLFKSGMHAKTRSGMRPFRGAAHLGRVERHGQALIAAP